MRIQNRSKGVISFDALLSMIPIILIFVFMMNAMFFIGRTTEERSQRQDILDKLVSIADYTVKSGAVVKDGSVRCPNWIEEGKLTASYVDDLRERAGLSELYISLEGPEEHQTCIYRIVVTGGQKEISRLFVCGG